MPPRKRTKKKQTFPRSFTVLLFLLATTIAFSIGFFVGETNKAREIVPVGEGVVTDQGDKPAYLEDDISFDQFWSVWNFIKEEFYRQPVSDKDLFYGSLKGLLSGLDDPYSVYFDPEETNKFNADLEGSFEGIGAEIGIKDDQLQIIAPLSGMPAEKAGLLPGDWIIKIDGTETRGMTVETAVSLIRGEGGTEVVLSIYNEGLEAIKDVTIVRGKIVIDSVKWETDDNNIMEISISTFNHDTGNLMNEAIQEALSTNVEGIVLNLRSNPGGLLSTAIGIASAWVGYDTVVIERTRSEANTFNGVAAPRLEDIPTVVLVNGGSASASEIVAGALQDYGYATVVGTQTFGKGSVQDYQELSDGSAVKITTAEWYTPNGRTINETGLAPDIEIAFTLEEYEAGIDPQLNAAKEILLGTYEPAEEETTEETDSTEDIETE
jgi:carboxyl-terminal processing protease